MVTNGEFDHEVLEKALERITSEILKRVRT